MATNSQSFESKKKKILLDLSVPDEEYTDLSPKGCIDVGIRDLIHDINRIPGLVTTSSCAGRISVFFEGRIGRGGSKSIAYGATEEALGLKGHGDRPNPQQPFAPAGGKGSGKWLFISHDPVACVSIEGTHFHELFNLTPGDGKVDVDHPGGLRLARFHFEPMVSCLCLHSCRSDLLVLNGVEYH